MDWHRSLMQNEACSHGDSEFHYGVRQGKVFEKMLTPAQRAAVNEFFRDSLLERLNAERGFLRSAADYAAHGWIARFNSLGLVMPQIEMIWKSWWSLDTPGRAIAALEYCSWLMYLEGDNPLFDASINERGNLGAFLWENDSHIYDCGWLRENVQFLKETLTAEFVMDAVRRAVDRLEGEPEHSLAQRLLRDLPDRRKLLESRTHE